MILLDSDHLTALKYTTGERSVRLRGRLAEASGEVLGTTVVNVEEQMKGWIAAVAKERQVRRQMSAYRELARLFTFIQPYHIALLTNAAVDRKHSHRGLGSQESIDPRMAHDSVGRPAFFQPVQPPSMLMTVV